MTDFSANDGVKKEEKRKEIAAGRFRAYSVQSADTSCPLFPPKRSIKIGTRNRKVFKKLKKGAEETRAAAVFCVAAPR